MFTNYDGNCSVDHMWIVHFLYSIALVCLVMLVAGCPPTPTEEEINEWCSAEPAMLPEAALEIDAGFEDRESAAIPTSFAGLEMTRTLLSDGGSILCAIDSSVPVMTRLDNEGVTDWEARFEGAVSYPSDLTAMPLSDGGFVLMSRDFTDDSYAESDVWVVRLDEAGVILWEASVDDANNDYAVSAVLLADGTTVIGGSSSTEDYATTSWLRGFDSDGLEAWTTSIEIGASLLGTTSQQTEVVVVALDRLVRIDQNGALVLDNEIDLQSHLSDPEVYSSLRAVDMAVTDDRVTVGGYGCGAQPEGACEYTLGWVAQLDLTGQTLWMQTLGEGGMCTRIDVTDLLVLDDGRILAGGSLTSRDVATSSWLNDVLLVTFDDEGIPLGHTSIGSVDDHQYLNSHVQLADNRVSLEGTSWNPDTHDDERWTLVFDVQ